jgi:hypothetical protein
MSYKHVNKRNQPDYFIVEGFPEPVKPTSERLKNWIIVILVLGIIGLMIYFS